MSVVHLCLSLQLLLRVTSTICTVQVDVSNNTKPWQPYVVFLHPFLLMYISIYLASLICRPRRRESKAWRCTSSAAALPVVTGGGTDWLTRGEPSTERSVSPWHWNLTGPVLLMTCVGLNLLACGICVPKFRVTSSMWAYCFWTCSLQSLYMQDVDLALKSA